MKNFFIGIWKGSRSEIFDKNDRVADMLNQPTSLVQTTTITIFSILHG